jgi:putative Holliday junction resolvase
MVQTTAMASLRDEERILGLDYGSKRIGISLSDPLKITAQALESVPNDERGMKRLQALIRERNVALVVVGMPFNLKGERAYKAKEVESFIHRLKQTTDVEIVIWDERFTTTIARQTLLQMGSKRKDRRNRGRVDAMAAAIILQGFLDSHKPSFGC